MIGLDTDLGIAAALMGLTPAQAALTTLSGRGMASAAWDVQTGKVTQFRFGSVDLRTRGVLSPVNVYKFGSQGQYKIETYPAISFNLAGMRYDRGPRRVHPQGDKVSVPVEGSVTTVVSAYGTSLTGYAQRAVRPHPEPFRLRYDVSMWALDDAEVTPLLATVTERLPPNGGLAVMWLDGSTRSLDLDLVGIVNVDEDTPTLSSPDGQRLWRWVYSYEVKTWMDNTFATELRRTITSPVEINMSATTEKL